MEAHELGPQDVFTSGMVALTSAVDQGTLLMEHVYPADPQALPLMKNTLTPGLEIRFERTHDLSAVIHAERLKDGRIMITAVPLLYGSYTAARGPGTFTLEPPLDLNLEPGFPLYKDTARKNAELRFANYREQNAPNRNAPMVSGLSPTPAPPPANELIRVEPAAQVQQPKVAVVSPTPTPPPASPTKSSKADKKKKGTPTPSPTPAKSPVMVAQASPTPTPVAPAVAGASPSAPAATASPSASPAENSLASTAGGGNWKTYLPGKMPVGRLITPTDLRDLADRGLGGERVYLKGQFVVNFTEPNRAVMRPKTGITDAVLKFAGGGKDVRIVVEFPAGYNPPTRGSTVTRDEARPYEITEVRKQADGQLNVFVREIMQ
jgi:hypothetical protein